MNKISYYILALLVAISLYSCEDVQTGPREPSGPWNAGPITEFTVTPINGGGEITYTIPDDPDILYVLAEYERNGKIFTEKSSIHTNKITIEGFHRVDRVKATLYAVNKYEQRSAPVEVEFEPLESLIDIAFNSLRVIPGFGGIVASWDNPKATELGVRLMTFDDSLYHDLVTREMYYSQIQKERHAFRGYEAVETQFALSFEDKWGNVSDTLHLTTTPFFETMVPKPYADFRSSIPYDNTSNLNTTTYGIEKLWDGIVNTSFNGWLTGNGFSGRSITIDMKQKVKLSRIVHHAYHVNSVYGQRNITQMEIWGTDEIDYTQLGNRDYWLDSISVADGYIHNVDPSLAMNLPKPNFKDDWEYLGWHNVPIYTAAADIQQLAQEGAEYEMPLEAKPVRYIRIYVREITFTQYLDNYFSMGEITFYGDNTIPQD